MRRKIPPTNEEYWGNVKRASRVAERLEHAFRRALPQCWTSTSVREFATVIDLRVGFADSEQAEQLCVQSLAVDRLASERTIERLVLVARVWCGRE